MGLIGATQEVFSFFSSLFELFPNAVRMLVLGVFGIFVLLAIINNIGR